MPKNTKRPAHPKRPKDVNQLAHHLVLLSTEGLAPVPSAEEISRVMSALGRRGGQIGGKKRAESLTEDRRKQIAQKAARARWSDKKH